MKILIGAAMTGFFAMAWTSPAAGYTAEDIVNSCAPAGESTEALISQSFCYGYIYGAAEVTADTSEHVCIETPVTAKELISVVTEFVAANPQLADSPARNVVMAALRREYPCRVP